MVLYVHKPGHSGPRGEAPRLVTLEEIDSITARLHQPGAGTEEARALALDQVRRHVRDQLLGKMISPDVLHLVAEEIILRYERAQVKARYPVGMAIQESTMGPVMQSTLNTFHKSGMLTDTGFEAVKEVLYLSVRRKNNHITINFKQRMDKYQIFALRSSFVFKTVGDCLSNKGGVQIDTAENIYRADGFESLADLPANHWGRLQRQIKRIDLQPDDVIFRLTFRPSELAAQNLTMSDVIYRILNNKSFIAHNYLSYAFSSLQEGVIEFYPKKTEIMIKAEATNRVRVYTAIRWFLNNRALPDIKKIKLTGIDGIASLYPRETPIVSMILSARQLSEEMKDNYYQMAPAYFAAKLNSQGLQPELRNNNAWLIRKNVSQGLFRGISDQEIVQLFSHPSINIKVIHGDQHNMLVVMPSEAGDISPGDWIVTALRQVPDPTNIEAKKLHDLLVQLSVHWYAVAEGDTLGKVLALPIVDRTRTYSNNFHVMAAYFGIEAARTYHVYNFYEIMSATGEIINSRFIEAFSSIATNRGVPLGVTPKGISQQAGGVASIMTNEQAANVMIMSSVNDKGGESTKATSASVIVGQRSGIGTGSYDYGVDFETVDPSLLAKTDFEQIDESSLDDLLDSKLNQAPRSEEFRPIFDNVRGDVSVSDSVLYSGKQRLPDLGHIRPDLSSKRKAPAIEMPTVIAPIGLLEAFENLIIPELIFGPVKISVDLTQEQISVSLIASLRPPFYGEGLPPSLKFLEALGEYTPILQQGVHTDEDIMSLIPPVIDRTDIPLVNSIKQESIGGGTSVNLTEEVDLKLPFVQMIPLPSENYQEVEAPDLSKLFSFAQIPRS